MLSKNINYKLCVGANAYEYILLYGFMESLGEYAFVMGWFGSTSI